MPPKKRKSITAEQESAAETYRKKLRSRNPGPSRPLKLVQQESALAKLSEEECKKYTIKNPYPQRFSLPESIIYYVARNPKNVQCHLNLMKTCKQLCRMSRILPVRDMLHCWKQANNKTCLANGTTSINLEDQFYKFWIYDELTIMKLTDKYFTSTLIQRIYKCSLREFTLKFQILTFRELEMLIDGGKLERIGWNSTTIKNDDESVTSFERVFELITCKCSDYMQIGMWSGNGFSENSAIKMKEILKPIKEFPMIYLNGIPQEIDMDAFSRLYRAGKRIDDTRNIYYHQLSPPGRLVGRVIVPWQMA